MNKWLLIWNMVLTILMVGMVVSGCSSIDPEFSNLASQVRSNRSAVEQLASAANENRQLINNNSAMIREQIKTILELKYFTETRVMGFRRFVLRMLRVAARSKGRPLTPL